MSIVSVRTQHAVFKFEDWDNLPVDNAWYGLRDNPCWPSDLAPEDPGWALLTNDEFYETQHQNLKQYRELYNEAPSAPDLERRPLEKRGQPPYPFSTIKKAEYKEKQFHNPAKKLWHIPDDYVGVLPSLNFPLPIKRNWINDTEEEPGNYTLPESRRENIDMVDIKKMTVEDIHLTEDEDLERMDDAQVDAWMTRYLELLRRQTETSSNTSPPVSDAQPTPAGQADPTPEAASVESLGFEELPQSTGYMNFNFFGCFSILRSKRVSR
ncbi:chitinase 18-9 [Apiospora hydei]|uniref:Chitinase 18-9 n=1 Tax=Apiospora hydei TaxID=1337664 RepID=A0ABR1XEH6_9PEZI